MTTPMTDPPPRPISVHVASAADGVFPGSQDNRKYIHSVFRTFVLAANTPVPILAQDRSRLTAWLIAYGNSVVLCDSQAQAQAPANQVAGGLGAAFANTPGNPDGTLLFVPVLVGPPTNSQTSMRWTLRSTEVVWAVSMAAAVLAVTIENSVTGY